MRAPLGVNRRSGSIVTAIVTALIALGTWYLQQHGGAAPGPAERSTQSTEAAATTPTATTPTAAGTEESTYDREAPGGETDPDSGLPFIEESVLPPEAHDTLRLIAAGGPFPHPDNDGVEFENREGILPDRSGGYYREYTVETPGSDDRGARRIVTGDAGEFYWTEDHYASFARIRR